MSLGSSESLLRRQKWTKALRADTVGPSGLPLFTFLSLPRLGAGPSIFPPSLLSQSLAEVVRGLSRGWPAPPLRSWDFITDLPSCLQPSIGPGPGDPRSMAACYLLDSVLSQLQKGKGPGQHNPKLALKASLLRQKTTRFESLSWGVGDGGAMAGGAGLTCTAVGPGLWLHGFRVL